MGLFNGKNKNGQLKIIMDHISGLPAAKVPFNVILDEEGQKLIFKQFANKKADEISLSFEKIESLANVPEETIKSGNVVGRAIVGGVLFGGAGAVVGALTAQDKTKTVYYKAINYISNNEEKCIILKSHGDINEFKLFRKLAEIITPAAE